MYDTTTIVAIFSAGLPSLLAVAFLFEFLGRRAWVFISEKAIHDPLKLMQFIMLHFIGAKWKAYNNIGYGTYKGTYKTEDDEVRIELEGLVAAFLTLILSPWVFYAAISYMAITLCLATVVGLLFIARFAYRINTKLEKHATDKNMHN